MNAATVAAPRVKTPEEVIDEHADAIGEIAKRLVKRVEFVERENNKLNFQLRDALDGVEELKAQIRTKDEMINELQALVVGKK